MMKLQPGGLQLAALNSNDALSCEGIDKDSWYHYGSLHDRTHDRMLGNVKFRKNICSIFYAIVLLYKDADFNVEAGTVFII